MKVSGDCLSFVLFYIIDFNLPGMDTLILDAGAGDGLGGLALKAAGFCGSIVGIDLTPNLLSLAKKRGCYSKIIEVDLSKTLPFENDCFGIVTCTGVLTYLEPESGVLQELIRVTKNEGLICFTSRTDHFDKWDVVARQLVSSRMWQKIHISDPLPYLPLNPEYSDKIKVIICCFQKILTSAPEP